MVTATTRPLTAWIVSLRVAELRGRLKEVTKTTADSKAIANPLASGDDEEADKA